MEIYEECNGNDRDRAGDRFQRPGLGHISGKDAAGTISFAACDETTCGHGARPDQRVASSGDQIAIGSGKGVSRYRAQDRITRSIAYRPTSPKRFRFPRPSRRDSTFLSRYQFQLSPSPPASKWRHWPKALKTEAESIGGNEIPNGKQGWYTCGNPPLKFVLGPLSKRF